MRALIVQIDDAFLPYMYDVAFAADQLEQYRKWAAVRIEALNHAHRRIAGGDASAITSAGAALTRRMSPTCR